MEMSAKVHTKFGFMSKNSQAQARGKNYNGITAPSSGRQVVLQGNHLLPICVQVSEAEEYSQNWPNACLETEDSTKVRAWRKVCPLACAPWSLGTVRSMDEPELSLHTDAAASAPSVRTMESPSSPSLSGRPSQLPPKLPAADLLSRWWQIWNFRSSASGRQISGNPVHLLWKVWF